MCVRVCLFDFVRGVSLSPRGDRNNHNIEQHIKNTHHNDDTRPRPRPRPRPTAAEPTLKKRTHTNRYPTPHADALHACCGPTHQTMDNTRRWFQGKCATGKAAEEAAAIMASNHRADANLCFGY